MINLNKIEYARDTPVLTDRLWVNTHWADGAGRTITFIVCQYKPKRSYDFIRPKGEFLKQGAKFDAYRNKSVHNVQCKGTVDVLGFSTSASLPGDGFGPHRLYPPSAKFVRDYPPLLNWYALLDYRPIREVYVGENPSMYYASVAYAETVPIVAPDGTVFNGYIAVTGTANVYSKPRPGKTVTPSVSNVSCIYAVPQEGSSSGVSRRSATCSSAGLSLPVGSVEDLASNATGWLDYAIACASGALHAAIPSIRFPSRPISQRLSRFVDIRPDEPGPIDLSRLEELVPTLLPAVEGLVPWENAELSSHAADLVSKYNDYSSNLLAYVGDLGKTGDTVKSMFKLVGNVKNPKAWAEAWLSYRYGDRLFIGDTKELLESISKRISTRMDRTIARARIEKAYSAGSFHVTRQRTSTVIAYNDSMNGVMTAINNLMRWDAWPTLQNTWDLIPLSFVVDWFLPVQDVLDHLDSAVQAPYIKVDSAYIGDKIVAKVHLTSSTWWGDVTLTEYRREQHNSLTDLRPFEAEIPPSSFGVIQQGDALALLVSSRRA